MEIKDSIVMADEIDDGIPLTYEEINKDEIFVGEIPFQVILENIEEQFSDYINQEDKVNYIDIFYEELDQSYALIKDDEEEHPEEKKEILDNLHQKFLETIGHLFEMRLAIHIRDLEDETNNSDLRIILRTLYEFFIINARNLFINVISHDILKSLGVGISDDQEFFQKVEELLYLYSPLIINITPVDFLKYGGGEEIQNMYDDGEVIGNFLRKYSPKLYQNEEFKIDLINQITILYQFRQNLIQQEDI